VLWLGRKRLFDLWRPAVICLVLAGPWYALCYGANGRVFLDEFIVRHHFGRFTTGELQHVQPFWFYAPVLAGALFPWTPLMLHLRRPSGEVFAKLLWSWPALALIFFSGSANKLPGYVLPALPALAALLGDAWARRAQVRYPIVACGACLGLLPILVRALPDAIAEGSGSAWSKMAGQNIWAVASLVAGLALATYLLDRKWGRHASAIFVAALVAVSIIRMHRDVFPALDETVSARGMWRRIADRSGSVCLDQPHRRFRYGMNYYSVSPLPDCGAEPRELRIRRP
jgi:4-amino-4-deoxy-L-arabinose transferase-like glycosyltransferase